MSRFTSKSESMGFSEFKPVSKSVKFHVQVYVGIHTPKLKSRAMSKSMPGTADDPQPKPEYLPEYWKIRKPKTKSRCTVPIMDPGGTPVIVTVPRKSVVPVLVSITDPGTHN